MLSIRLSDRPAIDHVADQDRRHRVDLPWRRPDPPTGRRHGAGLVVGAALGVLCWVLGIAVVLVDPIRSAALDAWPLAVLVAGLIAARLLVVCRR